MYGVAGLAVGCFFQSVKIRAFSGDKKGGGFLLPAVRITLARLKERHVLHVINKLRLLLRRRVPIKD